MSNIIELSSRWTMEQRIARLRRLADRELQEQVAKFERIKNSLEGDEVVASSSV